jgi:hypothetical protein
MTKIPLGQMERRVELLLFGKSHPVLASCFFFATFLFAALPFAIETDDVLIVSVCVIACFSSAILFIRLLLGKLGLVRYLLLIAPAILCYAAYAAGKEWHLVVIITGGTIICSHLIARLIGDFRPLIRNANL